MCVSVSVCVCVSLCLYVYQELIQDFGKVGVPVKVLKRGIFTRTHATFFPSL